MNTKGLSAAQKEMLAEIDVHGGVLVIPSYSLGRSKRARLLEGRGLVHITLLVGGSLHVTRTDAE